MEDFYMNQGWGWEAQAIEVGVGIGPGRPGQVFPSPGLPDQVFPGLGRPVEPEAQPVILPGRVPGLSTQNEEPPPTPELSLTGLQQGARVGKGGAERRRKRERGSGRERGSREEEKEGEVGKGGRERRRKRERGSSRERGSEEEEKEGEGERRLERRRTGGGEGERDRGQEQGEREKETKDRRRGRGTAGRGARESGRPNGSPARHPALLLTISLALLLFIWLLQTEEDSVPNAWQFRSGHSMVSKGVPNDIRLKDPNLPLLSRNGCTKKRSAESLIGTSSSQNRTAGTDQ
ncbi:hypothetical protein EJ110_NYTH42532 [Nymphaea thermarum]|nr:hypothetical protein EJ110_NYTH42532 [Nymphaea thermarum]